uniref:Ras-related protein Rab-18 n=1 Tax=Lotharella globosa TaxID=91324 RepID=A0A6U3EZW1_9EUKA|mmetsp:Transcript_17867/g.36067  ORF Transcript_17867/g.36067 Transcript_17867/m.36067 type:complete len:203 (+) Transcript_17867:62-670(+)
MSAGLSFDHLLKLLMVGESNVGKTSILIQYTSDSFDEKTKSTIGVDLKVKTIDFMGKKLKLTLWDTAGQERFRTLTASYYRGANGVVLVYDVTNRDSFEHVQHWLKEVDVYCTNEDVVTMLVANKIDKEQERKVSKEEGMAFARKHNMLFMECSAKTKQGVTQAFEELISKALETQCSKREVDGDDQVDLTNNSAQEDSLCC